jgi:hypothetical protein
MHLTSLTSSNATAAACVLYSAKHAQSKLAFEIGQAGHAMIHASLGILELLLERGRAHAWVLVGRQWTSYVKLDH